MRVQFGKQYLRMKHKIYLLSILIGFFAFEACDDVYDHTSAPPQSNEQENEQSVDGFTFALGSGLNSAIVLSEKNLEEESVFEAVKTTATPQLAEGAVVTFKLELSDTNAFDSFVEIASVSSDNSASVVAGDLNAAVKSLYGLAPSSREIYIRIKYYITEETSSVLMPGSVVLGPVAVTPVGPVIETGYYLIGDFNGWDIGNLNAYQFSHSGEDVYKDPIFSILMKDMAGNFKIVPKSSKEATSWDGVIGNTADQNPALEGELVIGGGSMLVEKAGWVKITLNMMEYTYAIEIISGNPMLYVPGGYQDWKPDLAPFIYSRNSDLVYEGYVYFNAPSEFKFTSERNWEGTNYGDGGNGELTTDGGAGDLSIGEAGYFRLIANLSELPYTWSAVKTEWGIIGDATPEGWERSTPMTFDPATGIWSVTTSLEAGKKFKFRANNDWDINLGGEINNLTYGGDDMSATETGTCLVTLNLSDPQVYRATITKQ